MTDTTWLSTALTRFDVEGPRYTSYPTVPNWLATDASFDGASYARDQATTPRDLAVYLHVPFCSRKCFFCGCNSVVRQASEDAGTDYVAAVVREASMRAEAFGPRSLRQLHVGGGTPTFLAPKALQQLLRAATDHFPVQSDTEVSVELDPARCTYQHLTMLREMGLDRVSVGVQDLDPEVQRLIGRGQTVEETDRVIGWVRQLGIRSINVDLIYGLPGQTVATLLQSIRTVTAMGASRLAIYGYAHVPHLRPNQRRINTVYLPSAASRVDMLMRAHDELLALGFVAIGMDHFARPDDELALALANGTLHRNFMGYTTRRGTDLLGLGASAISFAGDRYSQNEPHASHYRDAIETGCLPIVRTCHLTADDRLRADVIEQIMCQNRVDLAATAVRHGVDGRSYFASETAALAELAAMGVVENDGSVVAVTEHGRWFVRNVAMVFDKYLQTRAPSAARPAQHARAV